MATWLKDAIFMKYTHRVSTIPIYDGIGDFNAITAKA